MAALSHVRRDNARLRLDLAYIGLPSATARLFRLLAVHPGPDASAAAAAALADLPAGAVKDALDRLLQAQLVEPTSNGGARWRMRPPVREYAQGLSDVLGEKDERERARDRLVEYYLLAAEAADERLRGLPAIAVPEESTDRDGALAWLDAEWPCLTAMAQMAADTGREQAAKSLPLLMAQYLGFRGRFDELLAVTSVSLRAARKLGDRTAESEGLTNAGLAWYGLRQLPEAAQAHSAALTIVRETGDRLAEGQILNNLGLALHGLNQNDEAVRVHQEAAAIFRETGDRLDEGKALNNLGLALRGLNQNDQAARAHREAADIFRATGCPHEEANSLANLGNVLDDAGLQEEAGSAYRKAAGIFRETGDDRAELMVRQRLQLTLERS